MLEFIKSLFGNNKKNISDTKTISTYQNEFDVSNIDTIDSDDYLVSPEKALADKKTYLRLNNSTTI